ncbi:MAG: hypothetical protein KDB14_10570 [Planctomycetales bacterium]|nr:hypothetical protein [Planctomycetales bacterium]
MSTKFNNARSSLGLLVLLLASAKPVLAQPPVATLESSRYADAITELRQYRSAHPKDAAGSLVLAIAITGQQWGRIVESSWFVQLRDEIVKPGRTEAELNELYRKVQRDLTAVIASLDEATSLFQSATQADVKVPLRIGKLQVPTPGGRSTPWLSMVGASITNVESVVHLDQADAVWLRGQVELQLGLLRFLLAHDFRASLRIVHFKSNYPLDSFADLDSLDWPVTDPAMLKSSLQHLERFATLHHSVRALVEAEQDDDLEFVTAFDQTPTLNSRPVGKEVWDQRQEWFTLWQDLLAGRIGAPIIAEYPTFKNLFNARRAFLESKRFDLIGILHGDAIKPFLDPQLNLDRTQVQKLLTGFLGGYSQLMFPG